MSGPSAALSPLARVGLDELLAEVLDRVQDVLNTQDRLRRLLHAVVAISADLSLDVVLQRIVDAACDLASARYGALGVLSSAGPERRLREFITHGITPEQRERIGDLPRGDGILGAIIDRPTPLRVDALGNHELSHGFPANHPPMDTFLGVPILIRDKVFGNLYLTEKEGGEGFTDDDEQIVIALAAAAGVVIENARLYDVAARRQRWLEAAAETTAALMGSVSREDALQLIAHRAREVAAADIASVMLRADAGDDLVVRVVSGPPEGSGVGLAVSSTSSLAGQVVASGQMLVVEDLTRLDPASGEFSVPADWPTLGPLLLLPLRTATGVAGVLLVGWAADRVDAFRDTDVQLPAAFAEQAALALQVVRSREDQALLAVLEDRDRIGRDLHDLVIQRLFAVGLALENASRMAVARPEVAQRISGAVDNIDATIKDIRHSIFELSTPAGSTDLRAVVSETVAGLLPILGFAPDVDLSGPVDSGVPDTVRPHLLAVLHEALANVGRHAAASAVDVTLDVGEQITLTVRDDGKGIADTPRRSGLRNMRDRAEQLGGHFEVRPGAAGGTVLTWQVPSRPPPT